MGVVSDPSLKRLAKRYEELVLKQGLSHREAVAILADKFNISPITITRNHLYQARKRGFLTLRYGRPMLDEGEGERRRKYRARKKGSEGKNKREVDLTPEFRALFFDDEDGGITSEGIDKKARLSEILKDPQDRDPLQLLERLAGYQEFVASTSEIQQDHISIDLPDRRRYFLVGWGDLHLDNLHADIPRLRRELELIKALDAGVAFLGDGSDNPVKYHSFDTFLQPKVSRFIFGRIMDYIRPQLLVMFEGCHERHGAEVADVNYIEEYCRTRGIPYAGDRGRLSLHLAGQSYRFGLGHKARGYSMYNPFHAAVRLIREDFPDVDGVITGHIHQSGIACQVEQGRQRALLVIGTRKIGDRYASMRGFVPVEANKRLPVLELNGKRPGYVIYNDIEECAAKNLGSVR